MDMQCSWSYIPVLRRLSPLDLFFGDGNFECALYVKGYIKSSEIDDLVSSIQAVSISEFACDVKGCKAKFINPMDYNHHFNMIHRYQCVECFRNFPSAHLLSIHVSEVHDSWFLVQQEKGLAVYCCFVEGCPAKFKSDKERKDHLISIHKYPTDFRFSVSKRIHSKSCKGEMNWSTNMKNPEPMELSIGQKSSDSIKSLSKCNEQSMDVDSQHHHAMFKKQCGICLKIESKQVVPKTVCFGRGTPRGIVRSKLKH